MGPAELTAWTCLFIFMTMAPLVFSQPEPESEFVPGIFKQNKSSQSSIYYQTYAPILLEYKIPKFDINALTLNPAYSIYEFCRKEDYAHLCPPTFFIKQLVSGSFSGNLSSWNALPNSNPTNLHHTIDSSNFCHELTPHFADFKTSIHNLENYMSKLVECTLSNSNASFVARNIRDYDFRLKDFYANFTRSVERTYYDQTDSQTDDVAALNAHVGAYGIFLMHNLMESQRWTNSLSACRAGQIPNTLVTSQKLNAVLRSIEAKVLQRNFKLSISASDLSKYYKSSLTDCVLVDDLGTKSLMVRILVPIVEKTTKFEHLKVDTIPFLKSEDEICFVSKNSDKEVVFDHNSGQILESRCKPNELCKLPSYASEWPFTVNHCLSSFLLGRRDDVQKYCHMECIPYVNSNPIFKTVNASTITVAGRFRPTGNVKNLTVNCEGRKLELLEPLHKFYPGNSSIGALRIRLPCNCQLKYNQKMVFQSGSTHCDLGVNGSSVKHILPSAWMNQIEENGTEAEILDNYDETNYDDHDYVTGDDAGSDVKESSDDYIGPIPIELNCHLGLVYALTVVMLLILVAVSFILLKLMQIEKWRRRHESEGDKHPIMTYHVFNDQQDFNLNQTGGILH